LDYAPRESRGSTSLFPDTALVLGDEAADIEGWWGQTRDAYVSLGLPGQVAHFQTGAMGRLDSSTIFGIDSKMVGELCRGGARTETFSLQPEIGIVSKIQGRGHGIVFSAQEPSRLRII